MFLFCSNNNILYTITICIVWGRPPVSYLFSISETSTKTTLQIHPCRLTWDRGVCHRVGLATLGNATRRSTNSQSEFYSFHQFPKCQAFQVEFINQVVFDKSANSLCEVASVLSREGRAGSCKIRRPCQRVREAFSISFLFSFHSMPSLCFH